MHSPTDPLVTLHDARGRILHAGPLYSYSSEDLLQSVPWDWVDSEEEKQKIRDAYQQVLFDQKPVSCRIEVTLKDGSKVKYECRGTPVSAGEVVAIVSSVAIMEDEEINLTDRELELLRHLVAGRATKEIATEMDVKPTTVATYKARIKEKLGVDSLAGLIAYAHKHLR